MMQKIIIAVLIGAILCLVGIGFFCGPDKEKESTENLMEIVRDTVYIRDTVIVEKPIGRSSKVVDTMYVPVHDTTRIHDTLYVSLPYEVKTYKGDDYYAEVSGYNPSLYYLEVYPKREVVTKTEKILRSNLLSFGLEASYADTPFVPIYLEYERMFHRNAGIYARFLYNIPTQSYGFGIGAKICVGW